MQIDIDAHHDRHALPLRGQPRRRRRRHAARAAPAAASARRTAAGGRAIEEGRRLVGGHAAPRRRSRPTRSTRCGSSRELSARLPDDAIVTADSRLGRELVRPAAADSRGDMRGSLSGTLATMGPGVPVRDRREVRPPGPAGHRLRRRRRDADERHGRADHDRAVLAGVGRPAAGRGRAAQQRPQPGHLGDARHGGRPAVRRLPGAARRRLRRLRRLARPGPR